MEGFSVITFLGAVRLAIFVTALRKLVSGNNVLYYRPGIGRIKRHPAAKQKSQLNTAPNRAVSAKDRQCGVNRRQFLARIAGTCAVGEKWFAGFIILNIRMKDFPG